jgi:two-component system, chemotaxis family, sensor kinase CheA
MNGLESLLTSLGMEILTARAGSTDGQFPILDLLTNLQEVASHSSVQQKLRNLSEKGRERMVEIVKGAKPFTGPDVLWMRKLLVELQLSAGLIAAEQPQYAPDEGAPGVAAHEAPADDSINENDTPMSLNLGADLDLLMDFSTEIREHLDNIESGVLTLETKPDDRETLDTVFRAFHTTKGSAGFLNLGPINRLSHVLESLLELVRQHKLPINKRVIDLILRGRDTLKMFQNEIGERLSGKVPNQPINIRTLELRKDVQALIDSVQSATSPSGDSRRGMESQEEILDPDLVASGNTSGKTVSISLPTEAAASVDPESHFQAADEPTGAANRVEHNRVVKVDTRKLDALLDLVGEMVISQSQVSTGLSGLSAQNPQCARQLVQLSRVTKELQRISMSIRMVPIRSAFQRMARVVRDIGAKQNKRVQLLTEGEDTELDRGIVEQLYDPLLHIIRNSMDHGIEAKEIRIAKGKSAIGTIQLRAFHQGGNVIIEISDDGSGLDRERIRSKAIELGLASASAELADEEIFGYIFNPGFSTADTVTELSGRGVGLDVVRRNLENLRGSVFVSSVHGNGTQFKLSLPLTLAIINGLVVRVGTEQYIIPSISVRESFRPEPGMVTCVQGHGEVVNVRGRLIPLLRLHERFRIVPDSVDPLECIGVVIQAGANSRCLLVDALVTQQEVVIKNLNDLMAHKNRFLAGAAILGDGRVGLILDVNSLVNPEHKSYLTSVSRHRP